MSKAGDSDGLMKRVHIIMYILNEENVKNIWSGIRQKRGLLL